MLALLAMAPTGILLVLAASLGPVAAALRCEAVLSEGDCSGTFWEGKCYSQVADKVTFRQCIERCSIYGGALPTIRNQAENTFLDTTFGSMWLGLYNASAATNSEAKAADGWTWTSGCNDISFRNWDFGEPNNECEAGERCAVMLHRLEEDFGDMLAETWYDVHCTTKHPCICEAPGVVQPEVLAAMDGLEQEEELSQDCNTTVEPTRLKRVATAVKDWSLFETLAICLCTVCCCTACASCLLWRRKETLRVIDAEIGRSPQAAPRPSGIQTQHETSPTPPVVTRDLEA